MSDLRDVLDRKARQYRPSEDASFEKLVDRAERRHRNRRITSGVVALAVAVAGSLGAYGMLTGGRGEPAAGNDEFHALWPQQSESDARIAQSRANRGDDRLDWQQDAERFLGQFANDGLSWVNTTIPDVSESDAASDGPLTVTIQGYLNAACAHDQEWTCPESALDEARVTIERLIEPAPTGVWSVTGVTINGHTPDIENSPIPPVDTPAPVSDLPQEVGQFLFDFMGARASGPSNAEAYLTDNAFETYQGHQGGLDLYAYTQSGEAWEVVDWERTGDTWFVTVRILASDEVVEQILIGPPESKSDPLRVLSAERTE